MGCFIVRLALLNRFNEQKIGERYLLPFIFILMMTYLLNNTSFIDHIKPILAELFLSLLLLSIMQTNSVLARVLSIRSIVLFGNISASYS